MANFLSMHTLLTAVTIINKSEVREARWEEGKAIPPPYRPSRASFFPSPQLPYDLKGNLCNADGDGYENVA